MSKCYPTTQIAAGKYCHRDCPDINTYALLKVASGWEARCDDRQTRLELIRSQGQSQERGGGGTLGNQDGETSLGSLPKEEFV